MGKRAEVGTPKYLANAMKSKGLQKLRWYCQVCQKQCRDENGFKCHMQSEGHLRQMLVVGESAGRHINDYSSQFQHDFVQLLSRSCGTQRVKANNIYQDYIRDKNHLHMNATRWVTLSGFVKHLGRAGIVRVDETEKGLFIAWIDNSPKALAKAEANMKKERLTKSDEQRERQMISEQIEKAAVEKEEQRGSSDEDAADNTPPAELLQRPEGEPVKISLSLNKPAASEPSSATPSAPSGTGFSIKLGPSSPASTTKPVPTNPLSLKPVTNPLKMNPLKAAAAPKPGNVFKSAAASTPAPVSGTKREREPLSVAESLMMEDMARKRRRVDQPGLRA